MYVYSIGTGKSCTCLACTCTVCTYAWTCLLDIVFTFSPQNVNFDPTVQWWKLSNTGYEIGKQAPTPRIFELIDYKFNFSQTS